MKTKNLLLIVALFVMGWTACTTTDGVDFGNSEGTPQKKYTVRLSCAGELDITQQPLTRYTPSENDLYAVSVTQKPTSAGSSSAKNYAYGLFDNLANVELEVLEDHKYYVTIYMIVDGKNKVYSDSTYISDVLHKCYAEPFKVKKSSGVEFGVLTNKFTYSESEHFDSYSKLREVNASASYLNENIESYYGRSGEFVPTTNGETISVHMERMTYGIKFVAGDFLSEGILKIKLHVPNATSSYDYKSYELTPDNKTYETTLRYYKPSDWYGYDNLLDAKDTHGLDIEWQKNDTTTIALKKSYIKVNRLKQTIVNINMYEDQVLGNSSLSATYEDIEITESDTNQYTLGENQNEYVW